MYKLMLQLVVNGSCVQRWSRCMFSDTLVETRKPNCKWPGSIRRLLNEVVSISARTGLSVDHAIHSTQQTTDLSMSRSRRLPLCVLPP